MKKLIGVVLLVLLFATQSWAAWTVTLDTTGYPRQFSDSGRKLMVFKVNVTSDAGASGTIALSTLINTAFGAKSPAAQQWRDKLAGSTFYAFEYAHVGDVTAGTIVISNGIGSQLLSYAMGTAGAAIKSGYADLDFAAPLTDLQFASATIGNTEVSAFYFWVSK